MVPTPLLSLQRMSQVPAGLLPVAQQPPVVLSRTPPKSRKKSDPRISPCCASAPAAQEAHHPTLTSVDDLNRVMSLGTQQPGGAAALGRSTLSELLHQQGKQCGSAVLTSRLIAQAANIDLDEVIPA